MWVLVMVRLSKLSQKIVKKIQKSFQLGMDEITLNAVTLSTLKVFNYRMKIPEFCNNRYE